MLVKIHILIINWNLVSNRNFGQKIEFLRKNHKILLKIKISLKIKIFSNLKISAGQWKTLSFTQLQRVFYFNFWHSFKLEHRVLQDYLENWVDRVSAGQEQLFHFSCFLTFIRWAKNKAHSMFPRYRKHRIWNTDFWRRFLWSPRLLWNFADVG